jgi:hypothetical protein
MDSEARFNNLDFSINFLQTNFKCKIILVEEDVTSKIQGRYKDVQYIFIKSLFPIFQRTRLMNKAVNELLDTPYFCLYDMDVFINPETYIQAVEYLKEYSVVYPFNGRFYDIPQKYNQNKALRTSDIVDGDKVLLNVNSLGGAVFFRTTDFIKGGMENEMFLGWGYEDNERFVRFTKLGFRIKMMDNPMYHFIHPRGINSSGTNPHVRTNKTECEKIEKMSRAELVRHIDTTFHWCKQRKIMKISIVIPTYEMAGKGVEFLSYNIGKILEQTFTDFSVIISDHSLNTDIERLLDSYHDDRLVYLNNTTNRGICTANLNYGIMHADGEIIKPMFQDDYFYSKNALTVIHNAFLEGNKWVCVSSNSTKDRNKYSDTFTPKWNNDMVYGHNTMSSPSCIAYLKDNEIIWDETLLWLLDCKFYYDMYNKHGLPYFAKETLVTNFQHPDQVTNLLSAEQKQAEVNLMKQKYPK